MFFNFQYKYNLENTALKRIDSRRHFATILLIETFIRRRTLAVKSKVRSKMKSPFGLLFWALSFIISELNYVTNAVSYLLVFNQYFFLILIDF